MRTLSIRNVLAHETLDIPLAPGRTLVTGQNSAGKTSFARALAAVVCHKTNPAGLSAALAKSYLKDGSIEGFVEIDGGARWAVPNDMVIPEGVFPEASPHHVGIINFVAAMSGGEDARAKLFEDLFLPPHPEELLKPVWRHSAQQLTHVLKTIDKDGWTEAASVYKKMQLAHRRKWSDITGKTFGEKKAPEWRPDGWETDLEGLSEDDVLSSVTAAQDALRAATVQTAVDQEQIDQAVDIRDKRIPEQRAEIDRLTKKYEALKPTHDAASEKRRTAGTARQMAENAVNSAVAEFEWTEKKPKVADVPRCPACKVPLAVGQNGVFIHVDEPEPFSEEAFKQQVEACNANLAAAKREAEEAEGAFNRANKEYEDIRAQVVAVSRETEQARGVLGHMERQTGAADKEATQGNEAARSELEIARDRAAARKDAWIRNRDAQRSFDNFVDLAGIVKMIGPKGVRANHMQAAMDVVRSNLATISKVTGWLPITITKSYELVSGNRPAQLVAANESNKIQWGMQIALAMIYPTVRWVILDAADTLRGDHWAGLIELCNRFSAKREDLHIVVCATDSVAPEGWQIVELG